jgi:dTDP-4-amino-4,6-dideoxygalactose transaminase
MIGYRIPFNRPGLAGSEYRYVAEALGRGHISGDGAFTEKCHALLERSLPAHRVLLTTSCTHALEMCGLLLDLGPGDEVIVPSFTFVSTANAFAGRGARPVFADVRPDTLNLDEARLADRITPRTRAVVCVHYAGVGCEMDAILEVARRHGLVVIEDNAHGLFGKYRGKSLGTMGALGTLSFHETKNFTCGEGGALILNDPRHVDRAEIIREKGTNRKRYFRGEVDRYTWVDHGSSYLPSDLLAAFLYAQLEAREQILAKRRRVWELYRQALGGCAEDLGARLPFVPGHCELPYHMFPLLLRSRDARDGLIAHLTSKGILSVCHYVPLHLSDMGRKFGGKPGDCPVAEDVSERLVRLPFYNDLLPGDQESVVEAVREYLGAG